MIRLFSRNLVRFLILVVLQILVFNNIQLSGYVNPYLYILFILLLPFETPLWVSTFSGFILGLTIDMFVNTPGLHASASTFIGFMRPYVLRFMAPRDGYETGTFPRVYYYGLSWFFRYALVLTVSHHLVLFSLEAFSFAAVWHVLLRVALSSIFSVVLIVLSQYLVFRK